MKRRKLKLLQASIRLALAAIVIDACSCQLGNASASERDYLYTLRSGIDNWSDFRTSNGLLGWDDTPVCNWTGITCNSASLVTQINLGCYGCAKQAIGGLNTVLGNFTALEKVDISNQFITGQVPNLWSGPGQMQQLQSLNLSYNRLTGTLPAWLGDTALPMLQTLLLDNNQLSGSLPPEWGEPSVLPELRILHLQKNGLTGQLPAGWAKDISWPRLMELWLGGNNFTGAIPGTWLQVSGLQSLSLANNNLEGELPGFGEPSSLLSLDLSNNNFNGTLPSNWSYTGTSNLTRLFLNGCNFTGVLPPSWGLPSAFPMLEVLWLQVNELEGGLPASWTQQGAFPKLQDLALNDNWLMGTLEPSWGNATAFPALQNLSLGFNSFYRQLPEAWGQNGSFSSLQSLDLSANYLTGALPSSWGSPGAFSKLANLNLIWNRLSGTIPNSWGDLPALSTLWVQPGNYQLCKGAPPRSQAMLCAYLGAGCVPQTSLGSVCSVSPESTATYLPPSNTTTIMRAILRLQNTSAIAAGGVSQPLASALSYVMTSAQSLTVDQLVSPVAGASSFMLPSRNGTRSLLASAHMRILSGGAVATAAANRRLLANPPPNYPDILDAVVQFLAANGSTVYKMEEQLLTVLASKALLNVLSSSDVKLSAISLLAAAPSDEADVPDWWHGVAPWNPNNISVQSAPSPTTPGVPALGDSSKLSQSKENKIILPASIGGSVILIVLGICAVTFVRAKKRARKAAVHEDKTSTSSGDNHALSVGSSCAPSQGSSLDLVSRDGDSDALAVLQRRRWNQEEEAVGLEPGCPKSWRLSLPAMPWSDWEIPAAEIQICVRPSGLLWELGSGSFGKVYKAMRSASQPVAVKILHQQEESVAFKQEIALLKACRHSNIVAFQGVCIQKGETLLVTEFLEGGDLFKALSHPNARRMLQWSCCGRNIACDIARGLHYLHNHSVVHFDLKSHNILLSREGTAKITDVGLARITHNGYITNLESIAGTFAWAAPELLLGTRCSEKIDIYSFGVLLWELAVTSHTGERPVRGQLREVRVPEELPEDIEQLRQDCMEADPKLRPNAKEVYDRLSRATQPSAKPQQ